MFNAQDAYTTPCQLPPSQRSSPSSSVMMTTPFPPASGVSAPLGYTPAWNLRFTNQFTPYALFNGNSSTGSFSPHPAVGTAQTTSAEDSTGLRAQGEARGEALPPSRANGVVDRMNGADPHRVAYETSAHPPTHSPTPLYPPPLLPVDSHTASVVLSTRSAVAPRYVNPFANYTDRTSSISPTTQPHLGAQQRSSPSPESYSPPGPSSHQSSEVRVDRTRVSSTTPFRSGNEQSDRKCMNSLTSPPTLTFLPLNTNSGASSSQLFVEGCTSEQRMGQWPVHEKQTPGKVASAYTEGSNPPGGERWDGRSTTDSCSVPQPSCTNESSRTAADCFNGGNLERSMQANMYRTHQGTDAQYVMPQSEIRSQPCTHAISASAHAATFPPNDTAIYATAYPQPLYRPAMYSVTENGVSALISSPPSLGSPTPSTLPTQTPSPPPPPPPPSNLQHQHQSQHTSFLPTSPPGTPLPFHVSHVPIVITVNSFSPAPAQDTSTTSQSPSLSSTLSSVSGVTGTSRPSPPLPSTSQSITTLAAVAASPIRGTGASSPPSQYHQLRLGTAVNGEGNGSSLSIVSSDYVHSASLSQTRAATAPTMTTPVSRFALPSGNARHVGAATSSVAYVVPPDLRLWRVSGRDPSSTSVPQGLPAQSNTTRLQSPCESENGGGELSSDHIPDTEKVATSTDESSTMARTLVCPICQEEAGDGDRMATLRCTHSFHRTCLQSWLVRRGVCPLCRQNVLEGEQHPALTDGYDERRVTTPNSR